MLIVNTLLVIVLCALMAYGLQRFINAHPLSPAMVWVRGLQGGVVSVGICVLLGAILGMLAKAAPESRYYVFMVMTIGLAVMGLPIGVMSGILLHFRTVPKA